MTDPTNPSYPDVPDIAGDLAVTILESIGDGVVVVDADWNFTYVNPQAERFLGRLRDQLLGQSLWDAFPETLETAFARQFQRAAREKAEIAFEEYYPPLDKWFEVRAFPFHGGVSILFQDVSQRRRQEDALRESEELYRSLVENIDLGITLIGQDYRILMSNAAQGRFFAKPVGDFIGRHCFTEFEKRPEVCPHCPGTRAMAIGKPVTTEAEGLRDDGSQLTVRIKAFPVFDGDGVARRFIEVVEDISDRRQAELALRHSEERFQSLFAHASAGINILAPDGRFLQSNMAFEKFIGYSDEELQGMTPADITHPDNLEETRRYFTEVARGERSTFSYEKRFLRKDGRVVWGEVSTAWLFDETGQPTCGLGLVQDVTERKQAEIQLRRALRDTASSRDRIDAILSSVSDGLLVTDARQRLTHLNPAAEELLEFELTTVHLLPAGELPLNPDLCRQLQTPMSENQFLQCDFTLAGKAGPRVIQARSAPILSAGGEAGGAITILRDISREREIEQIKNEFISTAAHELRTPLASVMGYAELLLQLGHLPLPEQHDYLEKICEKAEVLAHIIDDLLDLSRIESGRLIALERNPADLNELLRDVIDQYRKGSPVHTFQLQLLLEPMILTIDREKILQVMENLLSNAVKYSPGGGTITVRTILTGDRFQITVTDQGIGMTSDQVERIFDKFYRADTSNTAIGGLGLGMTIVKKIIDGHGGEILVESAKGEGTRVEISLPIDTEPIRG